MSEEGPGRPGGAGDQDPVAQDADEQDAGEHGARDQDAGEHGAPEPGAGGHGAQPGDGHDWEAPWIEAMGAGRPERARLAAEFGEGVRKTNSLMQLMGQ